MSTHPGAWARIAKLGDAPLWRLDGPGTFVDAVTTHADEPLCEQLTSWGRSLGLTYRAQRWELSWFDEEDGGRRSILCEDLDEVAAEAEVRDVDPAEVRGTAGDPGRTVGDASARVDRVTVAAATDALREHPAGIPHADDGVLVVDALLLVAATTLEVDGVWWDEVLDPDRLSAPRGAIFPSRLPLWVPRREHWSA